MRAAFPGFLFLHTGLHSGRTRVTLEVLDAPPTIGDEWEDVVEASFRSETASVALVQGPGEWWPLPLAPMDYRVRYSAIGMDPAQREDTVLDGEPLQDRYLLQLWPAPPAPDAVIRETSLIAAGWHAIARTGGQKTRTGGDGQGLLRAPLGWAAARRTGPAD